MSYARGLTLAIIPILVIVVVGITYNNLTTYGYTNVNPVTSCSGLQCPQYNQNPCTVATNCQIQTPSFLNPTSPFTPLFNLDLIGFAAGFFRGPNATYTTQLQGNGTMTCTITTAAGIIANTSTLTLYNSFIQNPSVGDSIWGVCGGSYELFGPNTTLSFSNNFLHFQYGVNPTFPNQWVSSGAPIFAVTFPTNLVATSQIIVQAQWLFDTYISGAPKDSSPNFNNNIYGQGSTYTKTGSPCILSACGSINVANGTYFKGAPVLISTVILEPQFTLSAWIRPQLNTTDAGLIYSTAQKTGLTQATGWDFGYGSNGTIYFRYQDGNTEVTRVVANYASGFYTGKWYQIILSVANATSNGQYRNMQAYVNGTQVGNGLRDADVNTNINYTGSDHVLYGAGFAIGRMADGTNPTANGMSAYIQDGITIQTSISSYQAYQMWLAGASVIYQAGVVLPMTSYSVIVQTNSLTDATTINWILSIVGIGVGLLLLLIGLGLGFEAGAVTFNFALRPNSQGTRMAQTIGIGLLVWIPLYSEFGAPWVSVLIWGLSTFLFFALTGCFFFGIFDTISTASGESGA